MTPKAKISVGIYKGGGVYKHWRLFVEGSEEDDHLILHIIGSSQRFRFEMRAPDANDSSTLLEMVPLCEIPADKVERLVKVAQNQEIHNDIPAFNCQDWILDLLETLERKTIIDGKDEDYKENRQRLKGKAEGY